MQIVELRYFSFVNRKGDNKGVGVSLSWLEMKIKSKALHEGESHALVTHE